MAGTRDHDRDRRLMYEMRGTFDGGEFSCNTNFWFFSELVVESLVYFQRKVAQIVKSVCFTFDDFDFVIHTFQLSGVDGIITMIKDPVSISFQHPGKACHRWVFYGPGQFAPVIKSLAGPCP